MLICRRQRPHRGNLLAPSRLRRCARAGEWCSTDRWVQSGCGAKPGGSARSMTAAGIRRLRGITMRTPRSNGDGVIDVLNEIKPGRWQVNIVRNLRMPSEM